MPAHPLPRISGFAAAGALLLVLAFAWAIMAPSAALADDPVPLRGAYVLDNAGAITGSEDEVIAAIDSLYDKTGIKLFVVYVDRFEGTAPDDWANATAILNGFGSDDVLLAVAVEDRNFLVSYPDDFSLTESQTDAIETDRLIPELRDDKWAEAAIALAEGFADTASVPDGDSAGDPTGGGFPWLPVGAVVVAGGAGAFIYTRIRRKRKAAGGASRPGEPTQKELDQQSGRLLVQLDNSLKTSEQELGFAIAQFGDDATKQFSAALAEAKKKVTSAFELRQKLDDAFPETSDEKRELTQQIIELCTSADAELDAQSDAFDDLRRLEKTAPDALVAARAAAADAGSRLAAARTALASLHKTYSQSALAEVADNPDQVEKLLSFAEASAKETEKSLASGDSSAAAVSVRAAQQSIGQTKQLLDAIDTTAKDLALASSQLDAVVADTRQDLAAAKALPTGDNAGLAPAIAAAESALSSAESGTDPVASLVGLQAANTQLDGILTAVRTERERVERAKASLERALTTARAKISAVDDYITTRRGGIGSTARTRLSEARRHLESAAALATTDPIGALTEAQSAASLAEEASSSAQADVHGWDSRGNYADSSYEGAGLGGLLGELFGGGGGYGGGYGGGSSGGSIFGGGGSRSRSRSRGGSSFGGGSRSSSFGGSSRSSGRSSGGRRTSGGRF